MPPLTSEDFGFVERVVRARLRPLADLYRAMQAFEQDREAGNGRLGPYLVRQGLLSVEQLYDVLTSQPLPASPLQGGGVSPGPAEEPPHPATGTEVFSLSDVVVPAPATEDSEFELTVDGVASVLLCPFCHFENEVGALFCEQCKSDLAGIPSTPAPTRSPAPAPSPAPTRPPAPATDQAPLQPGLVLGGYRLVRELGRGGMGTVFLGEHVTSGHLAAVKVLHTTAGTTAVQRFLREASLLQILDHPNIVRVYNTGQEHGHVFIAMQYVSGQSATTLLRQQGPLPAGQAVRIALDIAAALAHTHRHRLVHRDIKPSNFLIDEDGNALLTDFGLAKSSLGDEAAGLTAEGHVGGTLAYIAPEQITDYRHVDIRSDLFGLGASLFQLLTGTMWLDTTAPWTQMVLQIMDMKAAPSVRARRPAVPPGLDDVVARLMQPRVEDRYQTPAQLLADLQALRLPADIPASLPRPVPPTPESSVCDLTLAGEILPRRSASPAEDSEADLVVEEGHPETVSALPLPVPAAAPAEVHVTEPATAERIDPVALALAEWQMLRGRDPDRAECLWEGLPESVRQSPSLAAAREWVARRRADRLFQQALEARRSGKTSDAVTLLEQALALAPDLREAAQTLEELRSAPVLDLEQLKARARAGKPQGAPALEGVLRQHVPADVLHDFLGRQPECSQYKDAHNLQEFLLESDDARARALRELLGLADLRHIAAELGVKEPAGGDKEKLIERILEEVGFRRLPLPEGLDTYARDVSATCRGLERERNVERLLGIGTKAFFIAERVLKDLVHFYGHWLHGPAYVDHLQRQKWVGAHARDLQKLSFGSLNQCFFGLAGEVIGHADFPRYFPGRKELVPDKLARRLRELEPHRNRVFSHDSPDSRAMAAPELRKVTGEVRDGLTGFFDHLRSGSVFPRKLVRDRTVEDRHGQRSYFCVCDGNDEVEVVTDEALDPGRVYLCLSASNPKFVHPILVPDLLSA